MATDLTATLATVDGQRVLVDCSASATYPPADFIPPPPFGVVNRSLWGPNLPGSGGLDTVGRLVTVCGEVTWMSAGSPWFMAVDDGSGVPVRADIDWSGGTPPDWLGEHVRVTGISDVIYRTPQDDDLEWDGESLAACWCRRIACDDEDDVVCPIASVSGGTASGTVSGDLIAPAPLEVPVRIYTAYGSTIIQPEDWNGNNSVPYSVTGVPGDATHRGLITAKAVGYASVSVFAYPGSNDVDVTLSDTSVLRFELSEPSVSPISCGQESQVTLRLWDAEGYILSGVSVHFTATHADWSEQDVETDEDGIVSVIVSPADGQDIVVAVAALGVQEQRTVAVKPERIMLWADPRLSASSTSTLSARLIDARRLGMPGETIAFTANSGGLLRDSQQNLVTQLAATSDSDGVAQATFVGGGSGTPSVTACHTDSCATQRCVTISAPTQPWKVGLVCYLCGVEDRARIEAFLGQVAQRYSDVTYSGINDISSGIDSSFSVVFVAMPTAALSQAELQSLSSFVQSGRLKRVVFLGEFNHYFWEFNNRLNDLTAAVGMLTQFSTGYGWYDDSVVLDRECAVNHLHYLTPGVTTMRDAATDTFADGWEGNALSLAYIHQHPTWPWIVEEDTAAAGSRIAVHDSTMMQYAYDEHDAMTPDKNLAFTHNLCTLFQQ